MKFVFVFFALIVVVAGDGASDAKWEEFKVCFFLPFLPPCIFPSNMCYAAFQFPIELK